MKQVMERIPELSVIVPNQCSYSKFYLLKTDGNIGILINTGGYGKINNFRWGTLYDNYETVPLTCGNGWGLDNTTILEDAINQGLNIGQVFEFDTFEEICEWFINYRRQ